MNIGRKALVVLGAIFLLLFVSFQLLAFSPKDLKPTGWVNDFANVMSPDARQALEQKLSEYEKQTSIEIFVVTVPSLEGLVVEDCAQQLADAWKPGKKGRDNGIIFLVAPNEHKMRIATGYGMEADLTDAQTFRIQENIAKPLFRQEKFSEGIIGVVDKIISTLGTTSYEMRIEERAKREREQQERAEMVGQIFLMVLACIFLIAAIVTPCVMIANHRARRKEAKKQAEKLLDKLVGLFVLAEAIFNKYKSSSAVRKALEDARRQFRLTESLRDASKINWVELLAILISVKETVDMAISRAEGEHDDALRAEERARQEKLGKEAEARQAEWDRLRPEEAAARKEKERKEVEEAERARRKADEERRRRREEEEREEEESRRRRSSSDSDHYSSDGGSSFGGGGGGSFGGGGSSSDW